jgi:hypothetical protein
MKRKREKSMAQKNQMIPALIAIKNYQKRATAITRKASKVKTQSKDQIETT